MAVGITGNIIKFVLFQREIDKQVKVLKEGQSDDDMEKYFFNVTMDPETKKPVVMKMLKPPMPTITMKPSEENPDGPPEIIIKAPEMT